MNTYYSQLRELCSSLCAQEWASNAFWLAAGVAIVALFFGAGTIARVIFSKDIGLVKTFLGMAAASAAAFAASAAWLTWGGPSMPLALSLGALAAGLALWVFSLLVRIPFGPVFGIGLTSLLLFGGVAHGAGRLCKLVAEVSVSVDAKPAAE